MSKNSYVILNLDDEIDLKYLIEKISYHLAHTNMKFGVFHRNEYNPKVKNVAVDIVNAILKAKGK